MDELIAQIMEKTGVTAEKARERREGGLVTTGCVAALLTRGYYSLTAPRSDSKPPTADTV